MSRAARDYAYFDAPAPLALAHRGGAALVGNHGIENTLAAFTAAVALGYRYLETDVHATRDGVVVAFHDDQLDRVTDRRGAIADLTWSEVAQARVGGREPVPTLAALLEELPEARLNVDLKADGAVRPTIELLHSMNAVDRVCVGSFSQRRLHQVRRLAGPRLATSAGQPGVAALRFLPGLVTRWLHSPAQALQIPATHRLLGHDVRLVTPGLLRRAHRLGKQVHVWTIDDPVEMHHLLDLGVDGIVTDRPDVLRTVLAERGIRLG